METEKNTENVWKAKQKNKENVENQAYQISQERALEMLEELLEQDQFELLLPEYKLVYMMNDAVESFLVFHGARMTGIYQDDYEGPLDASVTYENGEYVLVVHQDDSVVTLFYQSLSVEVHLYNYGEIGHFWVEGYEYLRQLEYRIAISGQIRISGTGILHTDRTETGNVRTVPATQLLLLPGGARINILYQKIIRGSRQKRRSQSWKNSQKKQTIKA